MEFIIGEVTPEPFWPAAIESSVRMGQASDGSFHIAMYFKNVTAEEEKIISNNKIKAKYLIDDTDSMLLTYIGYEGSDIIQEIVFDPTLYDKKEWIWRKNGWENNRIALILLIDSATGILKSLRIESFPEKLLIVRHKVWSNALAMPSYSNSYKRWIADAATFSIMQLWNWAEDAGYLSDRSLCSLDKVILYSI